MWNDILICDPMSYDEKYFQITAIILCKMQLIFANYFCKWTLAFLSN
jgi:hypothetical protein